MIQNWQPCGCNVANNAVRTDLEGQSTDATGVAQLRKVEDKGGCPSLMKAYVLNLDRGTLLHQLR
jgi:hypothetical protein